MGYNIEAKWVVRPWIFDSGKQVALKAGPHWTVVAAVPPTPVTPRFLWKFFEAFKDDGTPIGTVIRNEEFDLYIRAVPNSSKLELVPQTQLDWNCGWGFAPAAGSHSDRKYSPVLTHGSVLSRDWYGLVVSDSKGEDGHPVYLGPYRPSDYSVWSWSLR